MSHWGNPWLSSNSARWSHVPEPARLMVADWLKLELIHDFFDRLAEDGSSDTRRLKFWQGYHKYIDDMYFALGPRAAGNRGGDFKELRRKMEGRLLILDPAGLPGNNAFIMSMGDYVVVEFGVKGNACFIFRRSDLPFALSGRVAGDGTALKHASHVERLLHFDRGGRRWERIFEAGLARLLTVRLTRDRGDGVSPGRNVAPSVQRGNTAAGSPAPLPPAEIEPEFSMRSLERFSAVRRLRIHDHTQIGGNLWVVTDDTDTGAKRQLQAWGFTYRPGRGWWRGRR